MSPAGWVGIAWLLFGGSHLLLSSSPLRAALSRRLGTGGFVIGYTAVATVTLGLLIVAVWRLGGAGSPGLNLAAEPAARWTLGALALAGAALAIGGLVDYGRSPMAELARRGRAPGAVDARPLRPPVGFARITRHPFFAGLALLMAAHVLLAATLAQAVYFAGFALLAAIGMPLQDRKLLERHGEIYAEYLRHTSLVPFAAARRAGAGAGPGWSVGMTAIGGAVAVALLHPLWRIGHGAPFAILVLIGGLYAVARQLRYHQRR